MSDRIIHGKGKTETERSVIGCIAINGERCVGLAVEAGVTEAWFTDATCREAWETALEMFSTTKPMSIITIGNRMIELGSKPSELMFLEHCADEAVSEAHFEYTLDCLEMHVLCEREAATIAEHGVSAQQADPQAIRERLAEWQKKWSDLTGNYSKTTTIAEAALDWLIRIEKPHDQREGIIYWPLASLNETLNPLTDELVYICALESVGKTALALQMAIHNARLGTRVAVKSLESGIGRLVPRMIAHAGRLDRMRLERGQAQPEELRAAKSAAAEIGRLPLTLDDGGADVTQLRAWALNQKARGASLLIIDNLRHVRRKEVRDKSTAEQFSQLSAQIKHIRDDVRIPLIMLHHLTTDDVSWSKDIRKDADILIFLKDNEDETVKPTAHNHWTGRWVIDLDVKKHRDGEKGYAKKFWFDKPCQTYREYEDISALESTRHFDSGDSRGED